MLNPHQFSQQPCDMGALITPISQMRKLRLKEVEELTQGSPGRSHGIETLFSHIIGEHFG